MLAVFNLNNKEAKRELKVNYNNETLPFCSEPKYLGVTLDRSLTHVLPTPWVISQGANITHRTPEAACWLEQIACALPSGATVLTPALLTPPSTTPCEFWLDPCVLYQRANFQYSQEPNLLSFVAMVPQSLQNAVSWYLGICSTQG